MSGHDAEPGAGSLDRRGLLQAGAVVAAALPASVAVAQAPKFTLRHQVYFWLKRPGNTQDRDQLIAGLLKLAAIPQIRELHIGVPANTEARDVVDNSFDVSEHMVFGSLADQKIYQDHPLHKAFVDENSALFGRVVVRDSIDV